MIGREEERRGDERRRERRREEAGRNRGKSNNLHTDGGEKATKPFLACLGGSFESYGPQNKESGKYAHAGSSSEVEDHRRPQQSSSINRTSTNKSKHKELQKASFWSSETVQQKCKKRQFRLDETLGGVTKCCYLPQKRARDRTAGRGDTRTNETWRGRPRPSSKAVWVISCLSPPAP